MRRVLADTNLLVTALGWPRGVPAKALWHIVNEERLVLTDYILEELRDVIARKFPSQITTAERLLLELDYALLPVATSGVVIRDTKDQPILDSAIAAGVDIIVTGDKDFHALNLNEPRILTPRQYLDLVDSLSHAGPIE